MSVARSAGVISRDGRNAGASHTASAAAGTKTPSVTQGPEVDMMVERRAEAAQEGAGSRCHRAAGGRLSAASRHSSQLSRFSETTLWSGVFGAKATSASGRDRRAWGRRSRHAGLLRREPRDAKAPLARHVTDDTRHGDWLCGWLCEWGDGCGTRDRHQLTSRQGSPGSGLRRP